MTDDRIDSALRRIAAAVEQIEAHGGNGAAAAERRYQTLRAEAGVALRQLDEFIARLGG